MDKYQYDKTFTNAHRLSDLSHIKMTYVEAKIHLSTT